MGEILSRGGPLMYPLLATSIIALTVIIERLWFWRGVSRNRDLPLVCTILDLSGEGKLKEAAEKGGSSSDFIVRTLICGLTHHQFSLTEAMQMESNEQLKKMKKYLFVLETIITLAPLLGILGTVTGIIQSFDLLGSGSVVDPKGVTAGISQALITTAAGLTVAIITLIPYNYFLSRIESATSEIEKYATSLEIAIEKRRNSGEDTTAGKA